MTGLTLTRRTLCAAAVAVALPNEVFSAPEAPAVDRHALRAQRPERSILMAATTAGQRMVAVGERGIVVLSDDGGKQWRQALTPVSVTLTAVKFSNDMNGMAIGHGGCVLGTLDGGLTWTRLVDGRGLAQSTLNAARTKGDASALKKAERLIAEGPDKPLMDLILLDSRRAIVTGAYGLTYATEDAGRSWQSRTERLANPKSSHLYALRMRGPLLLLAGEQGLVLISEDAGASFQTVDVPYKGSFFTAEVLPNGQLMLGGLRGNVWISSNKGASWSQLQVPMSASITSSTLLADGGLLVSNQAGIVFVRKEGAFVALNADSPLSSINGLIPTRTGALALTMQGVAHVPLSAGARS